MGEAFVSRRGGGPGVVTGTIAFPSSSYVSTVTIPEIVGREHFALFLSPAGSSYVYLDMQNKAGAVSILKMENTVILHRGASGSINGETEAGSPYGGSYDKTTGTISAGACVFFQGTYQYIAW
ncbi:hypothetical protein [Oscillibacter sp.]|uniref:hypothetical protein n=1 Tax=Oscillibacter sp. TaxID=1945593 RepID=UPI00289C8045|nr:hypothetical protein [Oscillibacter sp.]